MAQTFKQLRRLHTAFCQHPIFTHQIKGKRIAKQLDGLQKNISLFNQINFQEFILDDFGITFKMKIDSIETSIKMELKINFQYPFQKPQVLIDHPIYGQGKDILQTILGPDNIWGPSMILSNIIQKLPQLAENINKLSLDDVLWDYRVQNEYSQVDLEQKGVKMFKIDQYEWRFMIKSTKKRIMGLTNDSVLVFIQKELNHIQLIDWIRMHNIKDVKTVIRDKSLQILVIDGRKNNKLYFGNTQQLQQILEFLDPIQMAERRIVQGQKMGQFGNKQKAISDYSLLVEHYSLNDKQKSLKYIKGMKKLISTEYQDQKDSKMLQK